MTFKKGQSGNPNGRPKHLMPDGRTVAEAARDFGPRALEVLIEVAEDKTAPASARAGAASTLIERGFGKATQPISGDPDGAPIQSETKFDLTGLPLEVQRQIAKVAL